MVHSRDHGAGQLTRVREANPKAGREKRIREEERESQREGGK
jgi:hypothetical protein